MTHHTCTPRRFSGLTALAVTAAVAAALAGCKSSASTGSSSAPAGTTASAAAAGSGSSGSSGGGSSAGSDYFPVAQGNTWVYKSSILSGLTSKATVTDKIIRVAPASDGQKVTMRTVESGLATFTETYVFHSDGSISVPFGSVTGGEVKVVSGSGVYWPSVANSAPGTTRKSTLHLVGSGIGHVTAHITVTSGGSRTVTVPAGTYNARAVIETIREKVAGHTVSIKLTTYLAAGVGPVKTVMDGSVGEVLKSFTHG